MYYVWSTERHRFSLSGDATNMAVKIEIKHFDGEVIECQIHNYQCTYAEYELYVYIYVYDVIWTGILVHFEHWTLNLQTHNGLFCWECVFVCVELQIWPSGCNCVCIIFWCANSLRQIDLFFYSAETFDRFLIQNILRCNLNFT